MVVSWHLYHPQTASVVALQPRTRRLRRKPPPFVRPMRKDKLMSETPDETQTEDVPDTTQEPTEEEEAEEDAGPSESARAAMAAAEEEEQFKKEYERENRRHRKTLERLVGADLGELACEACEGVGFITPGSQPVIPLEAKADAAECPLCKGYGQLLTPSKVEGHMLATCGQCAGTGWIPVTAPTNVLPIMPPTPAPAQQPMTGQYDPVRGFQPFGSDQWIPITLSSGQV